MFEQLAGDWANLGTLLGLYTFQGLPMGISGLIPILLQSRGATLSEQASFSFASWPFSFKILWAPIVDAYFWPTFGRRKSWFVPCQLVAGIFMLLIRNYLDYWLSPSSISVPAITATFFILYFLFATQDIAVDAWCLTLLKPKNVQYGATMNAIGQNLGFFIGNVLLFLLVDTTTSNDLRSRLSLPQSSLPILTLGDCCYYAGLLLIIYTIVVAVFVPEASTASASPQRVGPSASTASAARATSTSVSLSPTNPPYGGGGGSSARRRSPASTRRGGAPGGRPYEGDEGASESDTKVEDVERATLRRRGASRVREGRSGAVADRRAEPRTKSGGRVSGSRGGWMGGEEGGGGILSPFTHASGAEGGGGGDGQRHRSGRSSSTSSDFSDLGGANGSSSLSGSSDDGGRGEDRQQEGDVGSFYSETCPPYRGGDGADVGKGGRGRKRRGRGGKGEGNDAPETVGESYRMLGKVASSKPFQALLALILTSHISLSAWVSTNHLRLLDYGVPKQRLVLSLSPYLLVISIVAVPIYHAAARAFNVRRHPLSMWHAMFLPNFACMVVASVVLYLIPSQGVDAMWPWVVVGAGVSTITQSLSFAFVMESFVSFADPAVGGSYLTALLAVANLSKSVPRYLFTKLIGYLSTPPKAAVAVALPTPMETVGVNASAAAHAVHAAPSVPQQVVEEGAAALPDTRIPEYDAYFVVVGVSFVIGVVWWGVTRGVVKRLVSLPKTAWVVGA